MFKGKYLYLFCFGLLISAGPAKSSMMLDFEPFNRGEERCLRVIAFNTKAQKLLHHETLPCAPFKREVRSFMTQNLPEEVVADLELTCLVEFTVSEEVVLRPVVRPEGLLPLSQYNYIITSTRPVRYADGEPAFDLGLQRYFFLNCRIGEISPVQIKALVPRVKHKEAKEGFALAPAGIGNLEGLSRPEKENLGELLTQLTLFSFGYRSLPSKYQGNHGLDGIFQSFSGTFLILTQSKAGDSNPRAPTVMEKELNESHISTRLERMKNFGSHDVIATRSAVLQYLERAAANVFKMSHCLLDKGLAQVCVEQINIKGFPLTDVKLYSAPDLEKVEVIKGTLTKFSPNPVEQLCYCLSAIDLGAVPREEVMAKLLIRLGIPEERHDVYFDLIREEEDEARE